MTSVIRHIFYSLLPLVPAVIHATAPAITVTEKNGLNVFATSDGEYFRALGVNHFESAIETSDQIIANLYTWGFNAGGSNTPDALAQVLVHPKALNLLNVSRWMSEDQFQFEDVFNPEFKTKLTFRIQETCAKQRKYPLLIGYFWNDIPLWQDSDHPRGGWITFFRQLPSDSPGHQAWLNWRTQNPETPESDFLGVIATELYQCAYAAFKKFDPNRLILGDKYSESDLPEVVVRAALPFIDVLSIQVSSREFDPAFFDALYARYGKPIYISDHVAGFSTPEYPHTITQWTWPDPAAYAEYYTRYITAAFSHPHVVGYIRCQYQSVPRKGKPDTQKQGLLRMDGTPYAEIIPAVTAANHTAQSALLRALTNPE